LQYLQHSGWIVRTAAHVLVFDYVESLPQGSQLPVDLRLTADAFDERRVVVFVSHGHLHHFSPVIQGWARKRPDIQYVVGWPGANLPGAKVMQPRETWSSDGLIVRATGSTDQGM
jgi:L-ascorbate metabolism protein UlaG (beta-lactamase superfamily)